MLNKKLLYVVFLTSYAQAIGPEFGKTFLSVHPLFDVCSPERITSFRNQYDIKKDCNETMCKLDRNGAAIELVLFGSRTTHKTQIASYFMPGLRNSLTVGEDFSGATRSFTSDINALHLGILTQPANSSLLNNAENLTFESTLTFCPKQEVFGVGLAWQQRFCTKWWFDLTMPIQWVRNSLGVYENISDAGGTPAGGFTSVLEALGCNNAKLHYGHVTNKCLSKWGVSQIDFRIGRDLAKENLYSVGIYLGTTAPTGTKPKQFYLFEPQVGINHWGLMAGSYGHIKVHNQEKTDNINFFYEAAIRYLFSNFQQRSLDLIGKPWSRYMCIWPSENQLPDPTINTGVQDGFTQLNYLINYSTLCVKVQPHFDFMSNAALQYHNRILDFEVGYNIYAKKAETLCFSSSINDNIGLAGVRYWLNNHRTPVTRTLAQPGSATIVINDAGGAVDQQIETEGNTDVTYRRINLNDLDLRSASSPGMFNQTIYASLGKTWDNLKHPLFINGGASYEFACDNTAVSRWAAWLKLGFCI